jgi:5-bromo-4-chloroindolyl phosphate hydrolysis protein
VAPGLSQGDANSVIRDGRQKEAQIRQLGQEIRRPQVQAQVEQIADIVDSIYADFEQHPKDIGRLPDFSHTYLEPLVNVLNRYVALSSRAMAPSDDPTLTKIEHELLPAVETNFRTLYKQLAQDDIVDLDAASAGLQAMLELGSPSS